MRNERKIQNKIAYSAKDPLPPPHGDFCTYEKQKVGGVKEKEEMKNVHLLTHAEQILIQPKSCAGKTVVLVPTEPTHIPLQVLLYIWIGLDGLDFYFT